jgi:hypothetical protein
MRVVGGCCTNKQPDTLHQIHGRGTVRVLGMEAVNVEEAIAVGVRVTIGMVIGGILHRSTEVLTKALGTLGTRAFLSGGLGINFIQENDVVLLVNMTVVHMEDKLKLKQQCGHIQV